MDKPPGQKVVADRRWLIGIGISLVFGIFGAVMALLSYAERDKSQAHLAAPSIASSAAPVAALHSASPTPAPAPAPHRGKGRGRE